MSFGFGLGDFVTVVQFAKKIRKEFLDAPSQFNAISDEIKSLSNVLRDIDDVLPEPELTSQQKPELKDVADGFCDDDAPPPYELPAWELTSQQKSELRDIARGCLNVLNELKDTLKKYQELDSKSSYKTFVKKARKVWKGLQWEPEDIRDLRSRIASNISLLNAFNGRLASQASLETKHSVDQLNRYQKSLLKQSLAATESISWLHERQDDRERREDNQAILDWLTSVDYAPQQSDFLSRRQEGTGQWLLDSKKFHDWVDQSRQTIFCPGIPGAGKTILTSIVVNHLHTKFRSDPNVGIAYVYCNFRRQQEQKPTDLLASLLKQLLQEQPSIPESMKTLYGHHKIKGTRPSLDEISKELLSVTINFTRTFIIIDALDEFQVSGGGRSRFLSVVFNLQAKTGINLYATSRFIPEITREFETVTSLEIRARDEDVRSYLDGHMSPLPSFVRGNPSLQGEIKTKIVGAVEGMFLLAQLYLDSLVGKRSPKAIRTALNHLQKESRTPNNDDGSKALYDAYREAMERIERQNGDSPELAKQVLSWITCAKRPLTLSELRHALAVEINACELDEENLPEIEDMVSICAGLVTIDEESGIIRLVHYTTQQYFERTQSSWFPNAQRDIAMACVTYLSFDAFEAGFCLTDEEFEARLRLSALYDYAARNWGHHAYATSMEEHLLILDLLENEAKVSSSSQAMMASRGHLGDSGYSQRVPRQLRGVHLAAYFGLTQAMMVLLKNGHDPNFKDAHGQTPLTWAAWNGREAMAKLLFEKGAELESKNIYGRTALSWAAWNGHKMVVKLLLENGAELESKDKYDQTPLSWAALNGHDEVARLLIENGADLESKETIYGQTPLSRAAWNGQEAVVKVLLEKGADMESQSTSSSETPLSWAALNGHEAVAKQLAESKSSISSSQTPLSWAALDGHEAVVKLLLKSVKLELKSTSSSQTPLSQAVLNEHEAVAKLLLDKDAELESKDKCGRTPLWWAAWNGHETIVKLLLEKGAKLEPKDKLSRTPLSQAILNKHKAVAKLLLDEDIKLEPKGFTFNQTPLPQVSNWHEVAIKLLAKKSTELESKDITSGQTPLSWAAWNGHEAVLKLLLEKGANLESKDVLFGQTPLARAVWNGHEAVVKLLLENGAELESKDTLSGQTPLSRAALKGHKAVVKLLLEKGAELDSKDSTFGQTPLSWAALNGHKAVVKLLLKRGAELESKDTTFNHTPLSWAVWNGQEAVVKLLLEKGAEIESKDTLFGQTPLSWAAWNGHEAIAKLLLDNGADLESRDDTFGRTPLSWAAWNGCRAVVKLLLENGAELESRDATFNRTPLSWAVDNGREVVAKLLLEKGMDGEDGCEAVLKLLRKKGAELEFKETIFGQTPLS